jgi:hypothetical protein
MRTLHGRGARRYINDPHMIGPFLNVYFPRTTCTLTVELGLAETYASVREPLSQ